MCKKCSNNSCDGCCETVISKVGPKGPKGDKGKDGATGAVGPTGPAAFTPVNFRAQNSAFQSFTDAAPSGVDATLTYTATVAGKYAVQYYQKIKLDPNGDVSCGMECSLRLNAVGYGGTALVTRYSLESPLEESWDSVAIVDTIDLIIGDVVDISYQKTVSGPLSVSSVWVGVLSLFKIE